MSSAIYWIGVIITHNLPHHRKHDWRHSTIAWGDSVSSADLTGSLVSFMLVCPILILCISHVDWLIAKDVVMVLKNNWVP